jgi:hypothetical protein
MWTEMQASAAPALSTPVMDFTDQQLDSVGVKRYAYPSITPSEQQILGLWEL